MQFEGNHGRRCGISSQMGCIVTSKFGREDKPVSAFRFYKGIFLFCVVGMV